MDEFYTYDHRRCTEATLCVVEQMGGAANIVKVAQRLALADREHMIRYGRPIIGGEYVFTEYGIVPKVFVTASALPAALGWAVEWSPEDGHLVAARVPNLRCLSETDRVIIRHVLTECVDRSAGSLAKELWGSPFQK